MHLGLRFLYKSLISWIETSPIISKIINEMEITIDTIAISNSLIVIKKEINTNIKVVVAIQYIAIILA